MRNNTQTKSDVKVKVKSLLRVEGYTELENFKEYNLDHAIIFKVDTEYHLVIIGVGNIMANIKCTDREQGKESFRLMFEKSKASQGIFPKWKERPETEKSWLAFYVLLDQTCVK